MFGLTIRDVRKMAFDVAGKLNVKLKFANNLAGDKWYYGFMDRHPELSLRQPEATSRQRMKGFSRERVMKFL